MLCFQCREMSYTTGESPMLLLQFAEMKDSLECIRDLVQRCWYVFMMHFLVPLFASLF